MHKKNKFKKIISCHLSNPEYKFLLLSYMVMSAKSFELCKSCMFYVNDLMYQLPLLEEAYSDQYVCIPSCSFIILGNCFLISCL